MTIRSIWNEFSAKRRDENYVREFKAENCLDKCSGPLVTFNCPDEGSIVKNIRWDLVHFRFSAVTSHSWFGLLSEKVNTENIVSLGTSVVDMLYTNLVLSHFFGFDMDLDNVFVTLWYIYREHLSDDRNNEEILKAIESHLKARLMANKLYILSQDYTIVDLLFRYNNIDFGLRNSLGGNRTAMRAFIMATPFIEKILSTLYTFELSSEKMEHHRIFRCCNIVSCVFSSHVNIRLDMLVRAQCLCSKMRIVQSSPTVKHYLPLDSPIEDVDYHIVYPEDFFKVFSLPYPKNKAEFEETRRIILYTLSQIHEALWPNIKNNKREKRCAKIVYDFFKGHRSNIRIDVIEVDVEQCKKFTKGWFYANNNFWSKTPNKIIGDQGSNGIAINASTYRPVTHTPPKNPVADGKPFISFFYHLTRYCRNNTNEWPTAGDLILFTFQNLQSTVIVNDIFKNNCVHPKILSEMYVDFVEKALIVLRELAREQGHTWKDVAHRICATRLRAERIRFECEPYTT